MELKFINYEHKEKNISLTLTPGNIYGITGKNASELIPVISLRKLNKGQVTVNEEKINKENINEYRKKISLITTLFFILSIELF